LAKPEVPDCLGVRDTEDNDLKVGGGGLLPEDYEFEGNVEDRGAKFRAKMRHEHWAKMPKILKNKKYGYCGEH
jgi:hypothetical protein